jgi:bacterial mobilization protein MobC
MGTLYPKYKKERMIKMRERNWKFNVYLNTDEKSMLRKKAEATGLTTSALIRYLITDFKPKEKPPEEFYESLNSIRKIGNVLNQIAVRMHMIGYVEDEKNLRRTITNLNNMIMSIKEYYLLPDKTDKDNAN